MDLVETPSSGAVLRLRLYVARSTPNSVRAEHNLSLILDGLDLGTTPPELEIIDVFSQPRRAITDGIIVTPTLICQAADKRLFLMGDLTDHAQVRRVLMDLMTA
ncbi:MULTISPECIES: circadian clock KaiB family protein [Sphingosinicellaceae]|uniref:circadian clock KaiB family protein n=1 Tax=Sphingosinicellaceae TaxID=2820280 RepID=UPI001C1E120C|nr:MULTISPECIES: circadian clock KaiB family protein [Polymorphobacter]QYE33792.1 hypothetical protein KZX46_13200 [Polymorphobacter sp. PAMC 29334]UAJ08944.1 hypothetical protein KTC28_11255 [Polymorphobacter megasporae]